MSGADWSVVVPVKATAAAKSRIGGDAGWRTALALAMARDTVRAVLATPGILEVIVVTPSGAFADLPVRVVADPGGGLVAAARAGLAVAVSGNTAVLLGDVPAVAPHELGAALGLAAAHPRALVPDADLEGSVLVTSTGDHDLAFGTGSRSAHLERGYVELAGEWPGLRRDIDTADQLAAAVLPAWGEAAALLRADR